MNPGFPFEALEHDAIDNSRAEPESNTDQRRCRTGARGSVNHDPVLFDSAERFVENRQQAFHKLSHGKSSFPGGVEGGLLIDIVHLPDGVLQ